MYIELMKIDGWNSLELGIDDLIEYNFGIFLKTKRVLTIKTLLHDFALIDKTKYDVFIARAKLRIGNEETYEINKTKDGIYFYFKNGKIKAILSDLNSIAICDERRGK